MAVTDQILNTAASTLTPGVPGGKDQYDVLVQQAFSNNPDLLKNLNDPRTKKILMAAMGDSFVKGNEKFLTDIIPGLFEKLNVAQIDLSKADADAEIKAEAEKAKTYYDGWLERQKAQAEIDKQRATATLEANKTGFTKYESSAAGFAALSKFIAVIADCFEQGSFQPLKDFAAEFSKPKDVRVSADNASAVANAPSNEYSLQNPIMSGASTPNQLSSAMTSSAPAVALTGGTRDVSTQGSARIIADPSATLIRDNSGSITAAPSSGTTRNRSTTITQPQAIPQVPRINFGGRVPALENNK